MAAIEHILLSARSLVGCAQEARHVPAVEIGRAEQSVAPERNALLKPGARAHEAGTVLAGDSAPPPCYLGAR